MNAKTPSRVTARRSFHIWLMLLLPPITLGVLIFTTLRLLRKSPA